MGALVLDRMRSLSAEIAPSSGSDRRKIPGCCSFMIVRAGVVSRQAGYCSGIYGGSSWHPSPVEARAVGAQKPLHAVHQIGFGSLDDQVEVITHEAPGGPHPR